MEGPWHHVNRNYSGTSHKGETTNYDDFQPMGKHNIEGRRNSDNEDESSMGNSLPSNPSLLFPQEILLEERHEDEGTRSDFEIT